MSDQPDLFPETVKRPRGRPKKPNALSGAERMRRMREQAATVLYGAEAETGQTLADLSDTALIELVRAPVKRGYPGTVTEIMVELVKRAESRRASHVDPVRLARWVNGGWYEMTGPEDSRPVTENQGGNSVTVTENESRNKCNVTKNVGEPVEQNPSGDGKRPGRATYPAAIKAMALRMKAAGEPNTAIRQAILDAHGYAPGLNNLKLRLQQWAGEPDVQALLHGDE